MKSIDVLAHFNVEKLLSKIASVAKAIKIILTHLFPNHPFSTPCKHQTIGFLMFSKGRERVQGNFQPEQMG